MKLIKALLASLSILVTASCTQITADFSAGTGSSGSGGAPPEYYFRVKVGTVWDTLTAETTHKTCTINASSTASSEAVPTFNDCHVKIPESQLYNSSLKINVEAAAGNPCTTIVFNPYYVMRSNSAGYVSPDDGSTINCDGSTSPMPIGCFEGAARELAPSFPLNDGLLLITEGAAYARTFSASSGNTVRQTHTATGYNQGNYYTANNMIVAARNADVSIGMTQIYEADSMQDWEFICRDAYQEQLYALRIYISDYDSSTDQFRDWCGGADPNVLCPGQQ